MAYLVTSKYGCPLIFSEKPIRIGTKTVQYTGPKRNIVGETVEIPVYSDRTTRVPGAAIDIAYGGPNADISDFSTWAIIGPEDGSLYYGVLEEGIPIDPESATKLNNGKEQEFSDDPLEI